jgi:DNA recombination protein RmuC
MLKKQGDWGEVQLELILERSGLEKDKEYVIQGKGLGLKDEQGNTQKPDVIVNFPGNKHLILDSKVSLNNYYKYIEADSEQVKNKELELLLTAIKNHVDGLSGKKYEFNEKLNTPEYVLLFFPLEGALSLVADKNISGHNLSLTQYAWDKNIAIVTPTTLFTTMKTVSNLWQFEKQKKNVVKIAEESGKMYDKFVTLTNKLEGIKNRFQSTSKDFDDALGYMNSGKGNIVRQMDKIKTLGAKAKKQIDQDKWGGCEIELKSIEGDKKEVS